MSDATHTAGPWAFRNGFMGCIEIFPAKEPPELGQWAELATVELDYGDGDEGLSNAHLISAAPDMLAALKAAQDWFLALADGQKLDRIAMANSIMPQISAAISKAR